MKSEDILVYLGYFAVAAIALHFILAVLKVQSDYIYNTSIGFPNDKLQGSPIEGFQEGFTGEFNEKEKKQLEKAGEALDITMQRVEKDRMEGQRKRIKSCPSDTMEAIKDYITLIDEATVLNSLDSILGNIKGMKNGDKIGTTVENNSAMKKILNNPEQREMLFKLLDGKDANSSSGGGGGFM